MIHPGPGGIPLGGQRSKKTILGVSTAAQLMGPWAIAILDQILLQTREALILEKAAPCGRKGYRIVY
jgi:hypothetical protein